MSKIYQFKVFEEVARCSSMSEASKRLYLSQPTVSQVISGLEKYYNVRLFDRMNKSLYLTEQGREILDIVSELLQCYDEAERQIKEIAGHSQLRLGASGTAGSYYVNRAIRKMKDMLPDLQVKVMVCGTNYICSLLNQDKLDLALVDGSVTMADLESKRLLSERVSLVCSPDHPFAGRKEVELEELENQAFVMREYTNGISEAAKRFLKERGISYTCDWIYNSDDAVKAAVEQQGLLAILSESAVYEECRQGRLKIIPVKGMTLKHDICVAYHKRKFQSKEWKICLSCCESLAV